MIEVKELVFYYKGREEAALKSLDFQIAPGEILGFLGPSGSGKSTTQNILIGLLRNYQGLVKVMGRDLVDWGRDYYERIGVSFELPNHYQKLTALENLQYFRALYGVATEEPLYLLEKVGLEKDGRTRVANFSKGMQMRLNFARAFLNKPQLIFLDEPTSGLDPVNAKKIKQLILEEKSKGHTIFLTTHNMNIAEELCDRVAFLVDGRIVLIDEPRNLKISYGERIVAVSYRRQDRVELKEFSLEGLGENKKFLQILQNEDIYTIHTKESTLEEIFIQVTGRSLE